MGGTEGGVTAAAATALAASAAISRCVRATRAPHTVADRHARLEHAAFPSCQQASPRIWGSIAQSIGLRFRRPTVVPHRGFVDLPPREDHAPAKPRAFRPRVL